MIKPDVHVIGSTPSANLIIEDRQAVLCCFNRFSRQSKQSCGLSRPAALSYKCPPAERVLTRKKQLLLRLFLITHCRVNRKIRLLKTSFPKRIAF